MVILIWLATIFGLISSPEMTVTFFDVGQGDSAFIEWSDGTQMLVDGGPSTDVLSELGQVMLPWDRYIDYVVLTHPHADHSRGLVSVLDRFNVGTVIHTDQLYDEGWHEEFQRTVTASGADVLLPWEISIDNIEVIYPIDDGDYVNHSNVNESSIVMLLMGVNPILLMGDAGIVVEQRILNAGRVPRASIMKVGHHGSRTSTSRLWLRAVKPDVVVVSAGEDNRHGHPHKEVEDRLNELVDSVFRTDMSGTIRMKVFKDRLDIQTEN